MSWDFKREPNSRDRSSVLDNPSYHARVYHNPPIAGGKVEASGGTGQIATADWGWTVTKRSGPFATGKFTITGNSPTEGQAKIDVYRLLNDDCPNNPDLLAAWNKEGVIDTPVVDTPLP